MCGICGFVQSGSHACPVEREQLHSMAQTLEHRGPDSEGFYVSPDRVAGFGFRRLSIIDLSTGDQPIANEDGTLWVVFNGEIYNFRELRHTLESKGHVFHTQADTETIVHAYEEYGPDCVLHLRGMFAMAVWDEKRRRLFLARDRLGKKPLFYAATASGFYFASELKALLAIDSLPRELDSEGLDLYLTYGYIPAPWSILRVARKLPPAHWFLLDVESGTQRFERYWQPRYLPKQALGRAEACEQLKSQLTEAVRLRLMSDVPLGALLSGGLDSSLVVALMAQLSGRPVKTFTIGFEEDRYDERPYARLVAQRYGTEHHELVVRPNAAEVLPKLVWHLDEPMADSSALPTYYVAQMARQHVTVVLNGDGGDEIFGGYRHYRTILNVARFGQLPGSFRNGIAKPLFNWGYQLIRARPLQRAYRMAEQADWPAWAVHEQRMLMFGRAARERLYRDGSHLLDREYLRETYEQFDGCGRLDTMLQADLLTVLPGDLLVKMDRMSMAHSLEARSPLLDQQVVEFAAQLPELFKIEGNRTKVLLRHLATQYLPQELIVRRKQGFAIPIATWLQRDLGADVNAQLLDRGAKIHSFIDPAALAQILTAPDGLSTAVGGQIWALLVLETWLQQTSVL